MKLASNFNFIWLRQLGFVSGVKRIKDVGVNTQSTTGKLQYLFFLLVLIFNRDIFLWDII